MATWVVHFRIADYFLNILNVAETEFAAGSVAPDCGYGEKDSMGEFIPPPKVTHWSPSGFKRDCRYMDFSDKYLKNKDMTDKSYSFYLGYYIHLLTDIMWSKEIYIPTMEKYASGMEDERVLRAAKADWNDIDFEYLKENPDCQVYNILKEIKTVGDYLPYYEPNQLTVQIKFIADYYKSERKLNCEHKYLTGKEVDEFINRACKVIESDIRSKNLAQFKK